MSIGRRSLKKPDYIKIVKEENVRYSIENKIRNYIEAHKNDSTFCEEEYYIYKSPLSVFFKYLKLKPEHIKPFMHRSSFVYYTYCIYANEFLYEPNKEIQDEYTALRYYRGSWRDNIITFSGDLYRQKQRLYIARNKDDKGAKYWREETIENMKHFALYGKPKAGYLSYGAKAIVYLENYTPETLKFLHTNQSFILFDIARDGFLLNRLSYLFSLGKDESGKYIINKDTFKLAMGFDYDELIKEHREFKKSLEDVIYRATNLLVSKQHEKTIMSDNSDLIYSSSAVDVPQEIIILAKKLEKIHSQVGISNESSGFHLSIPDPELLETDGLKELSSRHLSINAEMFLGIGRYDVDNYPTAENRELYSKFYSKNKEVPCAVSMKTGKYYRVRDLLTMKPITQRDLNVTNVRHNIIDITNTSKNLIDDGTGVMVPAWCGKTIPISILPDKHPAIIYLKERGFDPVKLQDHLDVSYCIEAEPEDRSKGRFYSRLINGMRNTPTGRIILPIWIDGHRVGYQCRLIDKKIGDNYFVWDGFKYLPIKLKGNDLYPPNEKYPKGFNPHKYMNALGSKRNMMLMGYDQAVRWNKEKFTDKNDTFCILVEGPLDAAKIGPPAIAILGKSLSPMQADLIKSKFSKIIIVADNDKAGQEAKKCIYDRMAPFPVDEVTVTSGKDAGDLSYEDARNLVRSSEFYKE